MGEEFKGRGEQVGEVKKGEGWVQSWFHPGGTSFNRLRDFPAASSRQQRCDPPPTVKKIHPRESESGLQVLVVWSSCSASTTVSTLCCSECNHGNEPWNRPLRMKTIIKKMLFGETFVSTKAQISFENFFLYLLFLSETSGFTRSTLTCPAPPLGGVCQLGADGDGASRV